VRPQEPARQEHAPTVTLWRSRPLVFISSAMGELGDLRARIHARLEREGLVDDWVFEIHATSGGEPAEAQYLDLARACDLMALVVASEQSNPTEDEYSEACRDNPDKVIPVYLGSDAGDTCDFRRRIDRRHSRTIARDEDELIEKIAEGIERAIREGRVLARGLRDGFEARLAELDRLVDIEPPQSFVPRLVVDGQDVTWAEALTATPRLVVEGIGGAGKTYGALAELHRLTRVQRRPVRERAGDREVALDATIPLYLRASHGQTELDRLIQRAFSAVRFFPGADLTSEYAHRGQLALAVDGYDDLSVGDRIALLRSIEEWTRAHPRCRLIVVVRSLDPEALPDFARAAAAPLEEQQLVHLFSAQGLRGMIDVPPELEDLIVRPFWAAAFGRFGGQARTALELLQSVIARRLELAVSGEPARASKLRAALGEIARAIHPATALAQVDALTLLDCWQETDSVRRRFTPEPADALLDAIRASGLVVADAAGIVFVHPLLAVTLAAEATATDAGAPVPDDDELAAFTVALLSGERACELVDALCSRDIFFLARALRLSYERPRDTDLETDLATYEQALRTLAPVGGPEVEAALSDVHVVGAGTADWTAIRHFHVDSERVQAGWEELVALSGDPRVVVWQHSPFAAREPAFVAAAEILFRFKEVADPLTKTELEMLEEPPPAPTDDNELADALLAHASAAAAAERELRERLGLTDNPTLATLEGEPHVEVIVGDHGRYPHESWGHTEPEVVFSSSSNRPARGEGVAAQLADDPQRVARERLRRAIEQSIGSALGSAAWSRPSTLAGWVW
jgi:hypothetical protein